MCSLGLSVKDVRKDRGGGGWFICGQLKMEERGEGPCRRLLCNIK